MLNTIHFFRIKLCRLYLEIYSEFFIITPKETKSYLPNKELTLRVQPFQFRSQTPLQKGMPAEGTILQPVPDKLREGGAVVSALSVGKTINSEANNI